MPAKLILLPGASPQDEGEALVVAYLREHLPATYTLIPNAEIAEPGRPPFEYDLIVVAPHAVYAIEIKRWRGGIAGDDYSWLVDGKHRRQNPLPTVNNKARVLKSQIQRRRPDCDPLWVEAAVAIADDQGQLNLRGASRERVFRYTDLPGFLTNAAALGDRAADLHPRRDALDQAIQLAARGRQFGKLRFGDYEVLETIARRDRVAEYLAHNTLLRGGEPVRLRVFSYDPYLEPAELARRQEVIRRESEALQKIGPHSNLIVLRAFFTAPDDPNLFVEVTDWSDAGTLRTLMSSETLLSLERKLDLAIGIAAGLQAAHDAEVIHRDVRPENILIGRDGQPRLMNFDHARMVIPGGHTVGPITHDPDVPRTYIAPELLDPAHQLTPAADIYSLGMILFELLVGLPAFDTPEQARKYTSAGDPASYGGAIDIPTRLNDLVRRMTKTNPAERPQRAEEVLAELRAVREKPSGTLAAAAAPPEPPPAVEAEPHLFEVGQLIDGKYQVQKRLEAGGSGRVYKVYDGVLERVYALKIFNDTSMSFDFLKQEARSLLSVSDRSPHIVRVHTWGRLAQSGRVYLVADFVDGEELTKYTIPERRLPVREAVIAILDLLSVLALLHPDVDRIAELQARKDEGEITLEEYQELQRLQSEGWLHRDIKPANLMLTKDGLKLIDFNIAARASEASHTYIGTPGYMLPNIGNQMAQRWGTANDLFATGIVLYELVTGQHPYPNRDPASGEPPADPRRYVPDLHPAFATLLLRAVSTETNVGYRSARRFRQDLLDLNEVYLEATRAGPTAVQLTLEPWERDKPNYNPYVTRFLTLYSQARHDNSGTRGLDEIAQLTYVETRLDRLLRPAVLDGQYRLVIITGNAGDGKTAFIKNLEEVVRAEGVVIEQSTLNSSTFAYGGVRFYTNYDGSQDEGAERANDQVLGEFFAPFADDQIDHAPAQPTIHLIAINEGRLIDFFGSGTGSPDAALGFQRMSRTIHGFFDQDRGTTLPNWMLIIDLNQRSVVAKDPEAGNTSIFERQLAALLKPEFWEPCQSCALQQRCFIKFNADTLADPIAGPTVRERLRTLFEIVHLRLQLHMTMRDMRSALSWLIFRDHTCDDVGHLLSGPVPAQTHLSLFYYNAFAADSGPPEGRGDDRLVRLLRQIDLAEVANPAMDRLLHFQGFNDIQMLGFEQRSSIVADLLKAWNLPIGWESARQAGGVAAHQRQHAILRRIAFFERRDDRWKAMLPYQNLSNFRRATQDPSAKESARLKELLVEGVSLAEGARHPQLSRRFICLRAGRMAGATIKSFRLFPAADFAIQIPGTRGGAYLEYTPDRIVFYHDPQDTSQRLASARRAELIVSLDLLELLAQIREGFTPSADDISGFFINLIMFKHTLAHLPYRHVLLTRDDVRFYELVQQSNAIVTLRPRSAERVADEAQS